MSSGRQQSFASLQAFGLKADRLEQPAIAYGGFVVPGGETRSVSSRVWEIEQDEQGREGPADKAGSSAASGASATSGAPTAAGETTHSFGALIQGRLGAWELAELAASYPDAKLAASSASFDILTLRAGLFSNLPYRARLFVEIPYLDFAARFTQSIVPQLRVWSFWESGAETGLPIQSHHENPDGSMCVCLPTDWIRARDPVIAFVDFSVCWVAKALHEQLLGFYPGLQHLPPHLRLKRDRPNEYCGCGGNRRYGACCRRADLRVAPAVLEADRRATAIRYFAQLQAEGRMRDPLKVVGRKASPHII